MKFYFTGNALICLKGLFLKLFPAMMLTVLLSLTNCFQVSAKVGVQTIASNKKNVRLENALSAITPKNRKKQDRRSPALPELREIHGVVSDEATGDPVIGATVRVKGSSAGTVTDADGRFTLKVPDDAILEVSSIGYQTREINSDDQSSFTIKLQATATGLNQLVVVGYGVQKKKDITGAVSEVNLENLKSRSYKDVQQALQGKVPGVIIQNQGGDPTATPSVHIRGMGGINSESPLYIVDGTIYNGGPLNPNDIASISVLKDASAAIYGARASGGVILITTKKGEQGGLHLNFNERIGFQQPWKIPQALNAAQYAEVSNMAADNAGQPRKPVFDASVYPDGQITRTNWMKEAFRTGLLQDYNVGLSGGGDKSTFYSSFDYRKEEGILLNTYSERYDFRMNSEHHITNWLTLGEHLSLTYDDGQYGVNTTSGYEGAIISAIFYPPNVSVYKPDGSFNGLPDQYAGEYGDIINPVAYLKRLDSHNPQTGIFVNPYISVNLLRGLTFKSNLAITRNINTSKEFDSRVLETGKKFFNNTLTMRNGTVQSLLAEQTLNYKHLFGDAHNLDILLGYTFQKSTTNNFGVEAQNFDREDPQFRYFVNAQDIYPPTGGETLNALISYFGRVNYSYKDKYLFTGILRRDGSSKLPSSNRWDVYPSISAGWRISEENFMQDIRWLNSLKIRGSWGKMGNLASLPDNAINIPFEKLGNPAILGSPATQVYALAQNAISNPDLKWAISKQTDIGIDASILDDRISLTADYFKRITDRMIERIPVPSTAGTTYGPYVNLPGRARDFGWEVEVGYHSNANREFSYNINLNASGLKNKVLSLDDKIFPNGIGGFTVVRATLDPLRIAAGQPLYSYYVVKSAGTFKSQQEVDNYVNKDGEKIQPFAEPGDLKFIDANRDGRITPADRVYDGSNFPEFTYGLNANASYHGFDLNIFIQGVTGNKIFDAIKYTGLNASQQGYNMLKEVLKAWSPDNPGSNIPKVSYTDPNNNFGTASSWYLEDGSYARLKNITLGYTLPDALSRKLHINSLRFYITGQNVITLTQYPGFDPEVSSHGVDLGMYPVARSFLFGVDLSL